MAFRERRRSSVAPSSSMIDKVNTLMTKTGVTVTVIFVLTVGYNPTAYTLGKVGAVVFVLHSPVQKIGLLLASFNSVANPFVYVLLMPAFRDSLRKTFHLPPQRCGIASKNVVVVGSRTVGSSSDTATGGIEVTICGDREPPDTLTVSPNNKQLQMTPGMHTV